MSSNNGKAKGFFIGSRIGNRLEWFPPFRNAGGKDVSSRLRVPIAVNDRFGNTSWFDLVAWDNRADSLAHHLSQGKEMHFFCNITSDLLPVKDNRGNIIYQAALGHEKDAQGNPVAAGTQIPILTTRTSFVIDEWIFGADSRDYDAWIQSQAVNYPGGLEGLRAEQKRLSQLSYDGRSDRYGMAKVGKINGTPLQHVRKVAGNAAAPGGQPGMAINPQMAGAGAATPPPPGATGAATPPPPPANAEANVNGITLAMLRATTPPWTDDQIRASEYASLLGGTGTQAAAAGGGMPAYPGNSGV